MEKRIRAGLMMNAPVGVVDNKELRKFGLIFSSILLVLFELLLPWLKERPLPWWPLTVSVPIVTLALIWPAALRPLYIVWMKFGAVMGFINTRIIMTVLFFVVLTPIGWLMRALGKNPLLRELDRAAISYRVASTTQTKEDLEKPY
jgi:hypothetical protein